jgi:hypothetical protein
VASWLALKSTLGGYPANLIGFVCSFTVLVVVSLAIPTRSKTTAGGAVTI